MVARPRVRGLPSAVNYRGVRISTWLGTAVTGVIVASSLVVWAISASAKGDLSPFDHTFLWMLAGIVIVFFAGLYDDYRPARTRGLVRQLRGLLRGEVTSGVVKLVVIVGAAALVAWGMGARGLHFALAVPLLAGCANLWNLLDVAPGRALKFFVPTLVVIAIADGHVVFVTIASIALGAAIAALWVDLRERAMLGDAGSNVLGFIVGIGLLRVLPEYGLAVALVVVLALHVVAETVTFSKVIRGLRPLRWFDQLGRARIDTPK
jgi:UDP-GlcNAc:undecaprenyl-phosphate GlcNAc-1-phosphate transferase